MSNQLVLLMIFVAALVYRPSKAANPCSNIPEPCVCELADGSGTIDLTPLVTESNKDPLTAAANGFQYLFVFCGAIKDADLEHCDKTAAVCEYSQGYNMDIGRPETSRFEFRTNDKHSTQAIALVTDSPNNYDNSNRRTVAFLNCDASSSDISFQAYGYSKHDDPDNYLLYYMDFTGSIFCPGTKASSGLSVGSILLIIFFSLVTVYFGGGFLLLTFYFKRQGVERIPQQLFWLNLFQLIKEGLFFTWNTMKGPCRKGR